MIEALFLLKVGMLKDYTINPYFHTTILFDKTHFRKIPFSESLLSDAINCGWLLMKCSNIFEIKMFQWKITGQIAENEMLTR